MGNCECHRNSAQISTLFYKVETNSICWPDKPAGQLYLYIYRQQSHVSQIYLGSYQRLLGHQCCLLNKYLYETRNG
jgi:hypothetical protein